MILIAGIYIVAAMLVLNFFLGLKREVNVNYGIELKNIDLSNVSIQEQLDKMDEEDEEFLAAFTDEQYIEEFWDCVQVRLGLLDKIGIKADRVMQGYSKHLEKIKNRPR